MKVFETELLTEQFRFPHSKKKRIRKKWSSRNENYRPCTRCIYIQRVHALVCHPLLAEKMRNEAIRREIETARTRNPFGLLVGIYA